MKDIQYTTKKTAFDLRKNSLNNKLFNVNTTPNGSLVPKQEIFMQQIKSMGKKYMQENIFKRDREQFIKQKQKPHRQIVMSQEFIKSSKLYKLMKQKIDRSDSMHVKQVNCLNETKMKLKQQIMEVKSQNYQSKISLWELKNKIMELKMIFNQEEEQNKRLIQQERLYQEEQQEEEEGEQEGTFNEEQVAQRQGQQQGSEQLIEQRQNQLRYQKLRNQAHLEEEGPHYLQHQQEMKMEQAQNKFHENQKNQIQKDINQLKTHYYHDLKKKNNYSNKVLFVNKHKQMIQSLKQSNRPQQQWISDRNQRQQQEFIMKIKEKHIEKHQYLLQNKLDMLNFDQNLQEQKIKPFQEQQMQKCQQLNSINKFMEFSIQNSQKEDQLFQKLKKELGICSSQQRISLQNDLSEQNNKESTTHIQFA